MAVYADTSALVKLVVAENETPALHRWLQAAAPTLVSSDLARTELQRAVRRAAPQLMPDARRVLDAVILVEATPAIFDAAGRVTPIELRSLDAIHLVTALDLGDDLDALLAYDERLIDAATGHGIPTISPS